jgi:hypothetical protein
VRIWDVSPSLLCRQHLLGEHRELHGLWRILIEDRKGYARHPETRRWRGKLAALYERHEALVEEMARRGYQHASPLHRRQATGSAVQNEYVDSLTRSLRSSTARAAIAPYPTTGLTPDEACTASHSIGELPTCSYPS